MSNALGGFYQSQSEVVGCYLRFPDYIDLIEGSQDKLTKLINQLDKAMGMQISMVKSKVKTRHQVPIQKLDGGGNATEVTDHGSKLESQN